MRHASRLLLAAALVVATSAPAGAASLSLVGSTLGLSIGALPPLSVDQDPDPAVIQVSSAGGGFTEPAGLFLEPIIQVPKQLFTGVPLISGLTITNLGNATKVMTPGGGLPMTAGKPIRGGGGFGGPGALSGNTLVNVLLLFNLTIPINVVGATSGFVTAGGGGILITVRGTNWTTGAAKVTQITTGEPAENTVTISGFDNRTAGHAGDITLVAPFHVTTNVAGNLAGFAIQTLHFAPEPGAVLLLGAALGSVAVLGWRRLRR
jgi:hypothetical protein